MANRMKNKVCLVTGGGSGLGRASCLRFAEEGALVYVSDINLDAARKTYDLMLVADGQGKAIQQDVCDPDRWKSVIAEILEEQGRLDVLVNNAGIVHSASVEDETLEGWRKIQAVNMEAVYLGTQAAIGAMKENGGSIVNISSIEGLVGEPLTAAYNASKGGVRIFTKSAALHCAEQSYGIRINSIHPGFVGTPMVVNAVADLGDEMAAQFMEKVTSTIPMQRLGEPHEIANAVLFVASDESSYMTGAELVIDGGFTAR